VSNKKTVEWGPPLSFLIRKAHEEVAPWPLNETDANHETNSRKSESSAGTEWSKKHDIVFGQHKSARDPKHADPVEVKRTKFDDVDDVDGLTEAWLDAGLEMLLYKKANLKNVVNAHHKIEARNSCPKWPARALTFFIRGDPLDELLGDLEEEFSGKIVPHHGERFARLWYYWHAFGAAVGACSRAVSEKTIVGRMWSALISRIGRP